MEALTKNAFKMALQLRVVGGIHDGAVLQLDRQRHLVGSTASCDLILSEKDTRGHQVAIRHQGANLVIEVIEGQIIANGITPVPSGYGFRARLPAKIELHDIVLEFSSVIVERGRGFRAATVSQLCAIATVLGSFVVAIGQAENGSLTGVGSSTVDKVVVPSNSQPVPTAAVIEAKIREARLSGLTVEADGPRLTVSGSLEEKYQQSWVEIQSWFDRTYGGSYILASKIRAKMPTVVPKFQFRAIWFGERPYAIGSDGVLLYTGAALPGGWTIKDITEGRLVTTRMGEDFVLTF
ncbi:MULTISPECIES: SctD/MshK family protein [unclassified Phyllobacterium]|uniref:SctD/MshK family protein n=1 Tax=unclassified Phyllobacterium TaxID=2638441 RepID=UPI003012E269